VDTRALQVIYALDEIDSAVYVGQQVDVFIDAGNQTDEVDSSAQNAWPDESSGQASEQRHGGVTK
jgi:hypothetical protein